MMRLPHNHQTLRHQGKAGAILHAWLLTVLNQLNGKAHSIALHCESALSCREEKAGVQEWCNKYEGAANLAYVPDACPSTSSSSIGSSSSSTHIVMPWFTIQVALVLSQWLMYLAPAHSYSQDAACTSSYQGPCNDGQGPCNDGQESSYTSCRCSRRQCWLILAAARSMG